MTDDNPRRILNVQQQGHQFLLNGQYTQAAQYYETAIEAEPDVKSHYWYLGLVLLLQGQEVEAQTSWLFGMTNGEPKEIEQWTEELIQVLEIEAERQRWQVGDYKTAWIIRQHIREIQPENINNILHLVGLATLQNTYTGEELIEYNIIQQLKLQEITDIDTNLLAQVLNNIQNKAPLKQLTYELTEASLPYLKKSQIFIDNLIAFIYKLAYSNNEYYLAIKYTEQGLKIKQDHPELLRCVATFYQNTREYKKGIEAAIYCYEKLELLADKIHANMLIMRGVMKEGNNWDTFYSLMEKQKILLKKLIKEEPNNLSLDCAVRLFSSVFFFPYFQDLPQENINIRHQVSALAQINIENRSQDRIQKCRQWQTKKTNLLPSKRLKIGYISHCLRNHSVGWLARWIFQYHNHDKFEIYAYLLAAETQPSELQQWYLSKVDKAHQLGINDCDTAEKIYQDEIDILVDLDSVTLTNTCEVMALKPAPIQVTWLGWDASSIPSIDYYIADPYVLPEDAQDYYSETIWRLPQTYIAVDGFEVGVSQLRRDELGIANDAVIYLVAQSGYKYNTQTALLQMKILAEVENSYFIIKGLADKDAIKTFYAEIAESERVSAERLKVIPFSASEAIHRADLAIADVVLDTYPYNGATTTLETLWMGIPMVTRVGQQFASRNSYTMMMNAGITEGIAWTDEEYIEWGIRLGTDESLRQQVAWKLRKSRQTAPLWNGKQFTREMENAYQQMWQRYIDQ